jgi:5,10-methylenetetrahydromethanopterin reductase
MDWSAVPRVPIEMVPSGPAMLALAGRHADRIAIAVGAAPEVVGDYLRRARAAVEVAGRSAGSIEFGAYVPIVVNDDPAVARREVRRIASAFANFAAMRGQARAGSDERVPEPLRSGSTSVGALYDHTGDPYRGDVGTGALGAMSDDFITWFTAAGRPEDAIDRLRHLGAIGLDFVHLLSGHHAMPPEIRERNLELLATRVLPAVRNVGASTTSSIGEFTNG